MSLWKKVVTVLLGEPPKAPPRSVAETMALEAAEAEQDDETPKKRSKGKKTLDDVVVMDVEDSIDLHTFQPREVVKVVATYLDLAREKGFEEVRVIHGRGKGVQRAQVQALLKQHPSVESFSTPPQTRGGWGATLVRLLPPTEPERLNEERAVAASREMEAKAASKRKGSAAAPGKAAPGKKARSKKRRA